MERNEVTRRTALAGLTGLGVAGGLPALAHAGQNPEKEAPPKDAKEALGRLVEGNKRFVAGETRHAHQAAEWRKHLVVGQQPIATILGCSDSRVPPELVFDQRFGDLFVIRVAGNVIDPAVFGSIGYAVVHLKTALMVILGHEKCGAVTAALDGLRRKTEESPGIEALLKYVKPALKDIDPKLPAAKQVETGVEANVRFAVEQLAETPEGKKAVKEGRLEIVGGVYDLETGKVRFLD